MNTYEQMREALVKIRKIASINIDECVGDDSDARVIEIIDAALSKPPRNCDVGTPEEQCERFDAFCARHYGSNDMSRDNCRICPLSPMGCKLAWAQMPYTAEGEVTEWACMSKCQW